MITLQKSLRNPTLRNSYVISFQASSKMMQCVGSSLMEGDYTFILIYLTLSERKKKKSLG